MYYKGLECFARVPAARWSFHAPRQTRFLCRSTALITLSEEEKYYYREIPSFDAEYNSAAPSDYYELLGVDHDAQKESIKTAYRERQKIAHPDIAGVFKLISVCKQLVKTGQAAEDVSVLLNQAYKTLMNETLRVQYNNDLHSFHQSHGAFDGRPVSSWCGSNSEQRAVFVDETTCIGCRSCTTCAPGTFEMEDVWGRARVTHQWGDDEEWIREAIDMCPVDCIYIVQKKQLALLEFVMKSCAREDAAILARRRSGNMGAAPSNNNPFTKAAGFIRSRKNAKISEEEITSWRSLQNEELSSAIAKAWLQLPNHVRVKGWPAWSSENTVV